MDTVIFLDIDGVLNPQVHWDGINGLSGPILRLTESRLALVQELDTLGRVVWASTWSMDQTVLLATTIGFPPDTPSVSFVETHTDSLAAAMPTWKLPFVERWLRRQERIQERSYQAIVWIDDDLHRDAERWAGAQSLPTLLIRTDPATGLTSSGVARVRAFLTKSAGG